MTWIHEKSLQVREKVNEELKKENNPSFIDSFPFETTLGVCKNILPNISTTNAIIASQCCNEAIKFLTKKGNLLNNDWQYSG